MDSVQQRLDALLAPYRDVIGDDFAGYRGHVQRVAHLVLAAPALALSDDDIEQLCVAAVTHDLGIWTAGTFDYLEPSVALAVDMLSEMGREAWAPRVGTIVELHHRIRPIPGDPLAEAFRRADLCDLTFGRLRPGFPAGRWRELRREYPIAGFHQRLIVLTAKQTRREPRRPLPMLRW